MQISKWLVPAASAALGCGVVTQASLADTLLYDSHGFEASAGYVALSPIAGQPAAASDPWDAAVNATGTLSGSNAYVEPYLGATGTNLQFVEVIGQNLTPVTDYGYFFPTTYSSTAYNATGQQIAIRYTMAFQATGTNAVVGVTGFSSSVALGVAGINGLGKIYAPAGLTLTTAGQNFTATSGTFYQYELLLDYAAQTYSVFEAPADNVSPYVLMGTGAFLDGASASTFADADLSVFADPSSTTAVTGYGFFDAYTVSVVPEPTAVSALALCLLGGYRRRRSV